MDTATTSSAPFSSAQEFMLESGFGAWLERHTYESKIRYALYRAGFRAGRIEHIEEHRLTVVKGRSLDDLDFRPTRRISAAIRRAFKEEGLALTPSMLTVYRVGPRMLAHVGILEPEG